MVINNWKKIFQFIEKIQLLSEKSNKIYNINCTSFQQINTNYEIGNFNI